MARFVFLATMMVAVLARSVSLQAKEKRLPLPSKILKAKTIFIDNQSGHSKIGDRVYEELTKWGRFEIVADRSRADVVFLLTARESPGGISATAITPKSTGNPNPTITQVVGGQSEDTYTYLTILDAVTNESLWTDSKYGVRHGAARVIHELRKRIQEQEKP